MSFHFNGNFKSGSEFKSVLFFMSFGYIKQHTKKGFITLEVLFLIVGYSDFHHS